MAEARGLELCLGVGVCAVAVLVRLAVSLHPYSGAGQPPMYGDYEAQRHWMEIAFNLPIDEWYTNTSGNDLQYWGLDYPPLTAYHSLLCGYIAHWINPEWVALNKSRGYESYEHKLFMRYSVLVVDVVVFFTAAIAYCHLMYRRRDALWERTSLLCLILLQPALILIDNGHFQYNCASLGLAFWAIIFVTTNHDILGSFFFSLALNYKQMELYHAMPFFCYLLGKAWVSTGSNSKRVKKIALLGLAVIGTFVVCWYPFLWNWNQTLQVWNRLFPFSRGLYEDKVANIWCSLSVVIKLKKLLSLSALVKVTAVTTLAALVPSSVNLLWNPTPHRFLLALVNSSLIFFLLSFQVHEKSILLSTFPSSLLALHYPHTVTWFQVLALFSMYPLTTRDGLSLACWALGVLYFIVSISVQPTERTTGWYSHLCKMMATVSLALLLILCVASHIVSPPLHLPHLFPVLTSTLSCLLLTLFTTHTHILQFTTTSTLFNTDKHSSVGVTKETTDTMETETVATTQDNNPKVYEYTGRPIILTYPLTDKRQKLD